ncbi:hypothetical protein GGP49_000673 [Salinibacter ruber]|uniref:hypothetical protein n=1 Tax=Salinibacter ruber TaxID=146919 RepID=UPI0021678136|nr:hypothetical protein [Salinibacter ruber]MCS4113759.1 hypothetical protein [Salinibacter ruber]
MSSYATLLKRPLALGILLVFAGTFAACDSFVSNVDQPKDAAGDEQFNDPAEAEYLITGIRAQWADSHSGVTDLADGLSDEFRFGINSNATFPTFEQIDAGIIRDDNNSVTTALADLQEYRYLADDLLRRLEESNGFDPDAPAASASEAEIRYAANVHGANARYYLATYFGHPDDPRRGGATIDTSAFIPSPELYQRAENQVRERAGAGRGHGGRTASATGAVGAGPERPLRRHARLRGHRGTAGDGGPPGRRRVRPRRPSEGRVVGRGL